MSSDDRIERFTFSFTRADQDDRAFLALEPFGGRSAPPPTGLRTGSGGADGGSRR